MLFILKNNYLLISNFIKFGVVGFLGLIIDFLILFYLIEFVNISPEYARFFSLPVVILCTWFLNRTFTFRDNNKKLFQQISKYYIFMFIGVTVNYTIYYFLLDFFKDVKYGYSVALLLSSASSMIINFVNMKLFVFKKK